MELKQSVRHEIPLRIREKLKQLKDMDMALSENFIWLERDPTTELDANMGYFL